MKCNEIYNFKLYSNKKYIIPILVLVRIKLKNGLKKKSQVEWNVSICVVRKYRNSTLVMNNDTNPQKNYGL